MFITALFIKYVARISKSFSIQTSPAVKDMARIAQLMKEASIE